MRNITKIILLIFSIVISITFIINYNSTQEPIKINIPGGDGNVYDLTARVEREFNRLKDPNTGKIPFGIRQKELNFASKLPNDKMTKSATWTSRGPYNVGGRTRGIAIDITNDSIILAGSVSGGLWKSVNGGESWNRTSLPYQLPSVTCIAQDTRTGHTNTWYYGTGERYGTSASATGAFFYGDGIMKSTDNGQSWVSLESTFNNTPQSFDSHWNFVSRIVTDPINDTLDILYAATYGRINRSTDGGSTWETVVGPSSVSSYFTELAITSQSVLYATLSDDGNDKGIWRSENGLDWINITPFDTFPAAFDKIVIAINPSNENEVYFLGRTPGYGQHSDVFFNGEDWNSLWKYTYVSGNGTDTGGVWNNLSMNIPNNGTTKFDNFNSQGSYNLAIKINPSNPDVIIIGGTNLYRSIDGFTSMNNTTQIGGYQVGSYSPGGWGSYLNHHPDQHDLIFLPSDNNVLLSASDGGVARTDNIHDSIITWNSLNSGYLTTQLYTVGVDPSATDNMMVAGFQDNGNYYSNSEDSTVSWVMPLNGDGSYMGITNGADYFYLSIQRGRIYKMQLDGDGEPLAFGRIDPIGLYNPLFINPFVLDPNNNDIMYVAGGHTLWRNDQLSAIPMTGNYDSISMGWFSFSDTITNGSIRISAVAVSKSPANIVWYGTTNRRIYKVVNANTGDPSHEVMPVINFPPGNVSSIAIDPYDADKVMVAFSNYNIYSIFYTLDGGASWIEGAGNLEETWSGGGSGPSVRSLAILPLPEGNLYLAGTSTGLYATAHLDTTNTIWTQVGTDVLGNIIVEMVIARETDGLIVAATHGQGIYSTRITSLYDIVPQSIENFNNNETSLKVFPNPVKRNSNISFSIKKQDDINISVYDMSGKLINELTNKKYLIGEFNILFNTEALKSGNYLISLKGSFHKSSFKFTKP